MPNTKRTTQNLLRKTQTDWTHSVAQRIPQAQERRIGRERRSNDDAGRDPSNSSSHVSLLALKHRGRAEPSPKDHKQKERRTFIIDPPPPLFLYVCHFSQWGHISLLQWASSQLECLFSLFTWSILLFSSVIMHPLIKMRKWIVVFYFHNCQASSMRLKTHLPRERVTQCQ